MKDKIFTGDKKEGRSLLDNFREKLINWLVSKTPSWCRTQHLTLLTIPWSIFVIIFSYLSKFNINWFWLVSLIIILQWLTDNLDGAVGRARNEGLVKWGYYMDHFLDYVFLCSISIGYSILLYDNLKFIYFFVFAIFIGFMINSFLSFAITNKFRVTYFGISPTEVYLVLIIINALLIIFGKTYFAFSLPYLLIFSFLALCFIVFQTQAQIWKMDMENKKKIN